VRVQPRTGRTHQIRVHLASVDCPVLADKAYSGRDRLLLSDLQPGAEPDEVLLPRQALHAHRLRFLHPKSKTWIEAVAPLPAEFERTIAALREHCGLVVRPRRSNQSEIKRR
jgi:23S rRNA pseudouridine1911/1915/1917 synthase